MHLSVLGETVTLTNFPRVAVAIDAFVLLPDHFQIESARVRAFVSCIPLGSLLTANVGGVLDPVVEQSKLVQT